MKRDYIFVLIIGFLVGWLVLLPAKNVGFPLSAKWVALSVVGFTLLAPVALFVLKLLGKIWGIFEQFGKFAAVGTLNTLIDLGVLNLEILIFDVASGWYFSLFKAVSFLFATTNSYFWNKFWTFGSPTPVTTKEYTRFLLFTLVGTLIDVGIASFIVNGVRVPAGISGKLWANIGAIIGVFIALIWNFASYKLFVFKKVIANNANERGNNANI